VESGLYAPLTQVGLRHVRSDLQNPEQNWLDITPSALSPASECGY
jgi:hypothetical protein